MNNSNKLFVNNLKVIMKENNVNRVELAKELNIPYTTLCDWCTGRIIPKYEKLEILANYFKLSVSDLFGDRLLKDPDDDCTDEILMVTVAKEIPFDMTPSVAMKKFKYLPESIDTAKYSPKYSYFGLRLNDDSMSPFMNKLDYGVFQETSNIYSDGLYCIKKLNEPATIRKIVILKGGFLVIPVNQNNIYKIESYKDEDLENKIFILGKCIKYSHMVDYENEK